MSDLTIEPLDLDVAPGSQGWLDLVAVAKLADDTYEELEGDRGMSRTAEERQIMWRSERGADKQVWVARLAGEVSGYAFHRRPNHEGANMSWVFIAIRPDRRRHGIGGRLLDRVITEARAAGSSILQCQVMSPIEEGGAVLPVEDGPGAVPADAPSTRFAQNRGFRLVLAMVGVTIDTPVPPEILDAALQSVPASAGEYELRTWELPTPPELVDDLAMLRTRMATDTPRGGAAPAEDPWDAARIKGAEEKVSAVGRRRLYAGAVHRASNRLVAFTEIDIPREPGLPADQEYTLVLREHRGHGLGTLVKVANLRRLGELSPSTPSVKTFNADENAPMRRINELLGFYPHSVSGTWRLDL